MRDELGENGAQRPVLTPSESRQSVKTGRVRYILGISLSLAIVALAAVWVVGIF